MANTNTGFHSTYSRNLLIANEIINCQEPIILPDTNLKSAKKNKFKGIKEDIGSLSLTVYPNPAHDYFVVKSKFDTFTGPGVLTLYNSNGWAVECYPVTKKQDQILIPTVNLKSGLYILVIEENAKQWDKIKIAIIK